MKIKGSFSAVLLMSLWAVVGCSKVDPIVVNQLHGDWFDDAGQEMFIDVDKKQITIKPSDVVEINILKASGNNITIELIRNEQVAGIVCVLGTAELLVCRDINNVGQPFRWHRGTKPPKAAAPKTGGGDSAGAPTDSDGSGVQKEPAAEPATREDASEVPPVSN